ncbi:hypothetical protein ACIRL3_45850 [Streptomyces sp. NPDC102384]|uniref:hypothetical protein n=1 Tax=Streptomyces sp. NPDC102384 TaxID=3366166 RepID=UPI00382BC6FE
MLQNDPTADPSPDQLRFPPPIPNLVDEMDATESAITFGLGLVARRAAEAEYILHGIYVHLTEAEKAYSQLAVATGGTLVKQCKAQLDASALSTSCKAALAQDLVTAENSFRIRNRYLHGYWIYDDESYQWLTLKGAHGTQRPEITFTECDAVWELAEQLQGLCSRLLHWDTAHFGEPADAESGHEGLVSVKRT